LVEFENYWLGNQGGNCPSFSFDGSAIAPFAASPDCFIGRIKLEKNASNSKNSEMALWNRFNNVNPKQSFFH
jgi:hypothetical protein